MAHAVYVFAWAEVDQVCSESYFSQKSRVKKGTVSLKGQDGTVYSSGQTDDSGNACLPLPPVREDMIVTVEAGEGHRGEFLLQAQSLPDSLPIQAAASLEGADGLSQAAALQADGPNPADSPGILPDSEALRVLVREELKAQLSPINRALAQSQEGKSPGLREIIGGLGWLAGIAGLLLWLGAKNKKKLR
jgi:nickel transport protein